MTPQISRFLLVLILAGSAMLALLLLRRGKPSRTGPDGAGAGLGWGGGGPDPGGSCDGGGGCGGD
jgi:hypothetical protein